MRRLLLGLVAFAALVAGAPVHASTPLRWCGSGPSVTDRLPDAISAFSVHVVYARPATAPDRFAELAPRLVGDVAAIDAWWRAQDAGRAPRFDLFPGACESTFGTLDITTVVLPQEFGTVGNRAFSALRVLLAVGAGLAEPEKAYLVYYDGPTGQTGPGRVCGQAARIGGGSGLPGLAAVYLDSCSADRGDTTRPIVALHELVHVLGAVDDAAPNACSDGHVCDVSNDLMAAVLSAGELETRVLDGGRDDYYGHAGAWPDLRDSLFLEPLDSPDRLAPAEPAALVARDDPTGLVALSWGASTDDVGPVAYRVYRDGRFLRQLSGTSALAGVTAGGTSVYAVRAVDAVGRLSGTVAVRFRDGVGIVDEQGRLIRDTVRPPALSRILVRRSGANVVLSWPAVRDAGGVRSYRVVVGTRALRVSKTSVKLARTGLRTAVSIAAVDQAGNIGPARTIPLRRLR